MNAGAEFYLITMEKKETEPIEVKDGVARLPTDNATVQGTVISIGDVVLTPAAVGQTLYFNPFIAQHVKDNIYAVLDKHVLAYE